MLCSITEGFPYTLIEAMTCGRPCVATDVGGVTEALADTGLVVPPRSPQPLAEACLTLLQDDDRRRSMGAAARQRALEYFTVDRAISSFDEIYESLGSGRLPERPAAERDEPADPVPLRAPDDHRNRAGPAVSPAPAVAEADTQPFPVLVVPSSPVRAAG